MANTVSLSAGSPRHTPPTSISASGTAVARCEGADGRRPAAPPGLDSSSKTSVRAGEVAVDPRRARVRRMQRRVRHASSEGVAQVASWAWWLVTLTYAQAGAWQPYHITRARLALKAWLRSQGVRVCPLWLFVAEIQGKRLLRLGEAAVHYHVLLGLPAGIKCPKFDELGLWPHGWSNRDVARNPVGYLVKYASKGLGEFEGTFPPGLRLFGVSGLFEAARRRVRWLCSPSWLRDVARKSGLGIDTANLRRVVGGWVDLDFGEVFRSPWRFLGMRDGCAVFALAGVANASA